MTGEFSIVGLGRIRAIRARQALSKGIRILFESRDHRRDWTSAIAMIRRQLGGHPYGANTRVAAIRRTGRAAGFEPRPVESAGTR